MKSKWIAIAKQIQSTLVMSSALLIVSATAAIAAAYKTSSNQVVVTGLQPRRQYSVQTISSLGRNGTRTITTNACGQALISNGTSYQRLTINNETIIPSSLPTQTHRRCNPPRNSSTTKPLSGNSR